METVENSPLDLATLTKEEVSEILGKFDVICTDCDGVLWFESQLFAKSNDFINSMLDAGKRVYFITNNNMISRETLLAKLTKFNFRAGIENVTTPCHTFAQYLKKINFNRKVYVIGFEQIGKDLDSVGIEHIGIGPDVLEPNLVEYCQQKYKIDPEVGAVIVGVDPYFSFPKLLKAINYLKNPEVLFFCTNSDDKLDFPNMVFPDSGSVVASIEAGSRRKAQVVGKVSPLVCDLIAESSLPVNNEKTLMIGDRIDVDVVFGKNCNMKTLLVGTGMSKMKDVKEVMRKIEEKNDENLSKMIPDYWIENGIQELWEKIN